MLKETIKDRQEFIHILKIAQKKFLVNQTNIIQTLTLHVTL